MTKEDRLLRIGKDPRFSKIKSKKSKIQIDSRFRSVLNDESFNIMSKFDKYGRKASLSNDTKSLANIYQLESEQDDSQIETTSIERSESDGSTSESSSEFIGFDDKEEEVTLNHPQAQNDIEFGDRTFRLAITNLDWDFIKAADLFKLLDSFRPKGGFVKSAKIYISDFGKERLKLEDIHGPLLSVLKSTEIKEQNENLKNSVSIEQNENLSEVPLEHALLSNEESEDTNQLALKKYKLDRLRYYYAIIECDSASTASHIYDCCDGAEFEKSSNFLDLRFVPDDIQFNEEDSKDVCFSVSDINYKPKDFSTNSLQNSKQTLAWDEDDAERIRLTKRTLSREEVENADFASIIASSESEQDEEKFKKYKSLLLADAIDTGNPYGKERDMDEDMEIIFTPGLAEVATDLLDKKRERDEQLLETPFETILRKGKEKRKEKRKGLAATYKDSTEDAFSQEKKLPASAANTDKDELHCGEFKVNTEDERFSAVFDSSIYAIDPTHPSFKATEGTKAILKKKLSKSKRL